MTVTFEEIQFWAQSHETSPEVAMAINEEAGNDFDEMERIWQDPTADEFARVSDRAFQLAPEDDEKLFWGLETLHRNGRRSLIF